MAENPVAFAVEIRKLLKDYDQILDGVAGRTGHVWQYLTDILKYLKKCLSLEDSDDDNESDYLVPKSSNSVYINLETDFECCDKIWPDSESLKDHFYKRGHPGTNISKKEFDAIMIFLYYRSIFRDCWIEQTQLSSNTCLDMLMLERKIFLTLEDCEFQQHKSYFPPIDDTIEEKCFKPFKKQGDIMCLLCPEKILSSHDYIPHIESWKHTALLEENEQKNPSVSKKLHLIMKTNEIDVLTDIARALMNDDPICDQAIDELDNLLSDYYPNVEVYVFGSRVMGTATTYSDVDVYIDLDGKGYHGEVEVDTTTTISKISNILRYSNDWKRLEVVYNAKVPILIGFSVIGQFSCDLSFKDGLARANSLIIANYVENNGLCHQMMVAVKEWFKSTNLKKGDKCVFKSYQMYLLVLFYLQCEKHLPSVYTLQKNIEQSYISGWKIEVDEMPVNYQIAATSGKFKKYLKDFFDFYADFDYEEYIISPYAGRRVNKRLCSRKGYLFTEFEGYYGAYFSKNLSSLRDTFDTPMAIQDLIELDSNNSDRVTEDDLENFIYECKYSRWMLDKMGF